MSLERNTKLEYSDLSALKSFYSFSQKPIDHQEPQKLFLLVSYKAHNQ